MEQSPELRNLIVAWFEAASRGDDSLLDTHVSRDAEILLIGSDPSEWFEGARVTEFLRGEVQASGGRVQFSPGEPQAFSEGPMGWAVTRPTITLPDGKSVSPRWSAVFRQEDGVWKFVHLHVSFGVSNETWAGYWQADLQRRDGDPAGRGASARDVSGGQARGHVPAPSPRMSAALEVARQG